MSEGKHFTVMVEVKETQEPQPIMNPSGYPVKSPGGGDRMTERRVLDRLRLVVTAEDEQDAVRRAISMLQSQMPNKPVLQGMAMGAKPEGTVATIRA